MFFEHQIETPVERGFLLLFFFVEVKFIPKIVLHSLADIASSRMLLSV